MKTPYFLFKPEKLTSNFNEFSKLCQKYFNDFKIAYSLKTNTSKEVVSKLKELKCGFEAASLREINLVKDTKTFKVLNGPCKAIEELSLAIKNDFLINIDSVSEIDKLREISTKPLKAIIRIAVFDNKFGFDISQLKEVINYAAEKQIEITGYHFHAGTQQNLKQYKEYLNSINKILKTLPQAKYLNLGGGFPDKEQQKNQGITLEHYFREITKILDCKDKTFILEPGRVLVSDAFELITKVCVIKKNFEDNYAILDAGINLLPKITLSRYKFAKLTPDKEASQKKEFILAGPLLFSNDILSRIYGNLNEGDLIRVENVGAYCQNLAWDISYDRPKIITQ